MRSNRRRRKVAERPAATGRRSADVASATCPEGEAGKQAEKACGAGNGVDDGTRTHDSRDHNPGLYQLSYAHHCQKRSNTSIGAPGRSRTCDHRLRRPVLYPTELRAPAGTKPTSTPLVSSVGRGSRIRTCDPLLPKQMRYQTAPCPEPMPSRPDPGTSPPRHTGARMIRRVPGLVN